MKIFYWLLILLLTNTGFSQTLWSEDWEGNWVTDWHVDNGTWEVGTPTSGPNIAYSGQKCAATVLAGNYSEPVITRLIRHTQFVVPPASENPRFRFWYWFSFNSSGDWGEVQIKVNNGNWVPISNRMNYQGGDAWSYGSVDLSSYSDSIVQLAFYFQSVNDGSSTPDVDQGWYIDDISLITGPYVFNNPEDFELGFGDWSADEGTWEVGVPTYGPTNAHSGQNCAGTNLDGNYQEPSNSRLVSQPFVVPAISENPAIQFWHWFSFNSVNDWGEIQISVENGPWQSISNHFTNTSSGAWTSFYVSLLSYADSTVKIAFYFQSVNDGSSTPDVSSGWYIDDIKIDGIMTGIEEIDAELPTKFILRQNYPNPFNPTTKINYQLPNAGFVTLKVYDVLGKEIAILVNEEKPAGSYEVEFNANNLSSGIYFYNLHAGDFVETRKMVLLR